MRGVAKLRFASPFIRKKATVFRQSLFVRIKGLEPPRLSASDPKSDVATNYTISAGSINEIYLSDISFFLLTVQR